MDKNKSKEIHSGIIGYFGDYPAHKNWLVRLIWRIKNRLGIQKRTGIPIVVSDTISSNNTMAYMMNDPHLITAIGLECECGNLLKTDEEQVNNICRECK